MFIKFILSIMSLLLLAFPGAGSAERDHMQESEKRHEMMQDREHLYDRQEQHSRERDEERIYGW